MITGIETHIRSKEFGSKVNLCQLVQLYLIKSSILPLGPYHIRALGAAAERSGRAADVSRS